MPRRRMGLNPIRYRSRRVLKFDGEVAHYAAIEHARTHRRKEEQNRSQAGLMQQELAGAEKAEVHHGAAQGPGPQVAAEVTVLRDAGNHVGDALPPAHIGTDVAIEAD